LSYVYESFKINGDILHIGEIVKKSAGFSIVILLLISGMNFVQATAPHPAAQPLDLKEWTFMVYLDGDCDLEIYQTEAFLLMASVGSTADINILVQYDRIPGYDIRYGDWTDCKRFYVTLGMTPHSSNALSHLGEISMGDPLTLENFISWGITAYPAEKYALVLSDHGDNGGVCEDLTGNYDYLSCAEIYDTLQNVNASLGVAMDLIVYEACLMGAVEVAYHSSIGAKVIVGSEELGADYFPYDDVLSELAASPTMNSATLAQKFVYYYMLLWDGHPNSLYDVVSLSAFNLTLLARDLFPAVNALANNLSQVLTEHAYDILTAIADTEYTIPPISEYHCVADLYHFAQNIKKHMQDLQVQAAAQSVMDAIEAGRFAEWHGPAHTNFHGLSIYLPPTEDAYKTRTLVYSMDNMRWVTGTVWDDFLRALFVTYAPGIRSQEFLNDISIIPFDSDADDYLDAVHVKLDADTTAETVGVSVYGRLVDPLSNVVDTDNANWTIVSDEDEWCDLYLTMPVGGEEGWYNVELLLYDEYGILEDRNYSFEVAYLPEEMQHDVAVNDALIIKTIVGQGYPTEVKVTVEDKGHYPETFNVTTFVGGVAINTTTLTLMSNSNITFTIPWNTVNQTKGNYTVAIFAEPVDGETNTTNNNLDVGVELCVTGPGDIDGDNDVDIFDLVQMGGSYGTEEDHPAYIPNHDINSDGKIDIFDIVIAAGHYGESW
jgi:hypothetical protein